MQKNLLACILISLLFYAAYFSDQQFFISWFTSRYCRREYIKW